MTKENVKTGSVSRVILEYLALFMVVVIPLSVQAGLFKDDDKNSSSTSPYYHSSPVEVSLLAARQSRDPHDGLGGAEVMVDEDALVSSGPVGEDVITENRISTGEISIYTVREGDTLSHIADMYGVTANTILWANDLNKATNIREGQTLVILPIAGVQHVVKEGDTVASIAKKYDGDVEEILSYNQLANAGELVAGASIVVPGGAIHSAPVVRSATPTSVSGSTGSSVAGWSHPAPGSVKSQGLHGYNAVDLAGSIGSSVRAAAAGKVIVSKSSGWNGGYGQYIVIRHSNGAQTLYAHLSSNKVGVGEYVAQGKVIAGMGNTGKSTGPHLHFEVRGARNPF